MPSKFACIPSIAALLASPEGVRLVQQFGHRAVVQSLRRAAAGLRAGIATDGVQAVPQSTPAALLTVAQAALAAEQQPSLRRVFNLSGTVLHSNLGRAPLPAAAVDAMGSVAGYANLELDLRRGERGERDHHVSRRLCELTGAEKVALVNNNAAALLLVLNTLAQGREVVVSRGELIEIGGGFRLPEIMQCAGCRLIEVGTTNRTHTQDYRRAINTSTAALMKIHPSNYRILGFTHSVAPKITAAIAHEHALPLIHDLGSGILIDPQILGLPAETTVAEALAAGADAVTFSGDKLLGGPQCGIIVGRAQYIERIKQNPMYRAMRLDKIILAALEAVLLLYSDSQKALTELPTLRYLSRSGEHIRDQALRLCSRLPPVLSAHAVCRVVECSSRVGSGALPLASLPSAALALQPKHPGDSAAPRLARALRMLPLPVIGRIERATVLLDLRCLDDEAGFLHSLSQLGAP